MKRINLKKVTTFLAIAMIFILSISGLHAQTNEPGELEPGTTACWDTITVKEASQVLYCGTCSWVDNSTDSYWADKETC